MPPRGAPPSQIQFVRYNKQVSPPRWFADPILQNSLNTPSFRSRPICPSAFSTGRNPSTNTYYCRKHNNSEAICPWRNWMWSVFFLPTGDHAYRLCGNCTWLSPNPAPRHDRTDRLRLLGSKRTGGSRVRKSRWWCTVSHIVGSSSSHAHSAS